MGGLAAKLDDLGKVFPELAENARAVAQLDENVSRLGLEPFFEPVSVTLVSKGKKPDVLNGKRELLAVGAADLASWTRHIALGIRCRMRALEEPIIENLQRTQALPAMVLLRSHLEAAALTALCLEELTDAARQGSINRLRQLIPKTLFGTALKKHRDAVAVGDLLAFFEGDTIQICGAIDALDKFYYREHAEGTLSLVYSILCEYAHPNHRGVMDFMAASERPGGWEISYRLQASPRPELVAKALETLLVSMRAGYAAAELLRSWQFAEADGEIVYRGPSLEHCQRVWEELLQRPSAGAAEQ